MLTGSTKSLPPSHPPRCPHSQGLACIHKPEPGSPAGLYLAAPGCGAGGGRPVPHARAARRPLGLGTADGAAAG